MLFPLKKDDFEEKKFALSAFADCNVDLSPLSREAWQMRSFLGRWRRSAPSKSYGDPLDMAWHRCPQLMITNGSSNEVNVCCILSYKALDERRGRQSEEAKQPEEFPCLAVAFSKPFQCLSKRFNAFSMPFKAFQSVRRREFEVRHSLSPGLSFLEMELFDATRQPLHRHLSFGKPVVQTLVLCKDWVVLKAQLPPQTAHSLVLGRSWFQNDGGDVPETPIEAQDFRVQAGKRTFYLLNFLFLVLR